MENDIFIKDIIQLIEEIAPPALQESYDNVGMMVGKKNKVCTGIVLALDCTLEVVKTAIEEKKNFIITHHPLLFKGLKKITPQTEVEQIVFLAIKHDIAIYAAHTNLDNTLQYGVNKKMAHCIGLSHIKPLQPMPQMIHKIVVFVPKSHVEKVYQAMSIAGGGQMGDYDHCSFQSEGIGTFRGLENSTPFVGEKMKIHQEPEIKIEMICPQWRTQILVDEMLRIHPYEEVAYDIFSLQNTYNPYGSGAIGWLEKEMTEEDFLHHLKNTFHLQIIKHTEYCHKPVKKVALCGGAGIFLLPKAMQQQADIFITSDIKYHDFFLPTKSLLLADIGHWESEQFTIDIFSDLITNKFATFAPRITKKNTNPVHYFI